MGQIEVIAEVANAHQGDPSQAATIALSAARNGADAVKFQVYFADELLVRSHPRFEHFSNQAFSAETWSEVFEAVRPSARRIYCDVFGQKALDVAQQLDADGFKVHSSDLNNTALLRQLANVPGDVLLSAGGSTALEIAYALRILRQGAHQDRRIVLLHGFQSYPTQVEDSNLARIGQLDEWFGDYCRVGYMDHIDGGDPYAFILPQMAIAAGATVIEKHVTMDRSLQGVDYYSSIDIADFGGFVDQIRRAETAIGPRGIVFSESERKYREQVKKHWVTNSALPAGHVLCEKDLVMKRVAGHDAFCVELEKLVGRRLVHDVADEQPLTRRDLEFKATALVVARSRSQRLPGKATLDVAGVPALEHLFHRIKQAALVHDVVFCTTTDPDDEHLADLAEKNGLATYRGAIDNVLQRMLGALRDRPCDLVLRVTGDDILVDPEYADRAIQWHLSTNSEYSDLKGLPSGTEVEVFDRDLLERIYDLARDSEGTEYLTWYVTHQSDQFRISKVPVDPSHQKPWRLTMDTPEDYEVIGALLQTMAQNGKKFDYRMDDLVEFFAEHPEMLEINKPRHAGRGIDDVCTQLDWGRLLDSTR